MRIGILISVLLLIISLIAMPVNALDVYEHSYSDELIYGEIINDTQIYYINGTNDVAFHFEGGIPNCTLVYGVQYYFSWAELQWFPYVTNLQLEIDAHYEGIQIHGSIVNYALTDLAIVNDTITISITWNETRYSMVFIPAPDTNISSDIRDIHDYAIIVTIGDESGNQFQIPTESNLLTYLLMVIAFLAILAFAFASSFFLTADYFNLSIWSIVIAIGISVFIYTGLYDIWMLVIVAGLYTYMVIRW